MTKHFCDICGKELSDSWDMVDVRCVRHQVFRDFCIDCFRNKKNWRSINFFPLKKAKSDLEKALFKKKN